jgi:hypothetical protein
MLVAYYQHISAQHATAPRQPRSEQPHITPPRHRAESDHLGHWQKFNAIGRSENAVQDVCFEQYLFATRQLPVVCTELSIFPTVAAIKPNPELVPTLK